MVLMSTKCRTVTLILEGHRACSHQKHMSLYVRIVTASIDALLACACAFARARVRVLVCAQKAHSRDFLWNMSCMLHGARHTSSYDRVLKNGSVAAPIILIGWVGARRSGMWPTRHTERTGHAQAGLNARNPNFCTHARAWGVGMRRSNPGGLACTVAGPVRPSVQLPVMGTHGPTRVRMTCACAHAPNKTHMQQDPLGPDPGPGHAQRSHS